MTDGTYCMYTALTPMARSYLVCAILIPRTSAPFPPSRIGSKRTAVQLEAPSTFELSSAEKDQDRLSP
jgi:hypothetical protein